MNTRLPFTLPSKPPKRNKIVNLRCTDAEWTTIVGFARQLGLSASEVLRQCVLQAEALYRSQNPTPYRLDGDE